MTYDDFLKSFIEENKDNVTRDRLFGGYDLPKYDYDRLTEILFKKHYQELLDKGVSEKKAKSQAEKMSIEDARYVFPNACETKMVFTINARSLYNFFHHRCCERAQWEIRELATEMLRLVREVAPILFNNVGPNCLNGPCPEGNMSCGKAKEIREKFNNL